MQAPTIVVVKALAQSSINRIWEAMGLGPSTFSVPLCEAVGIATPQTPPTHFLMQDSGATQQDVDTWAAMAQSNDLPSLPNSVVWGENGIISAAEAQTAISSGNMFVFPAYGLVTAQDRANWLNGALSALNLQFIPPEL